LPLFILIILLYRNRYEYQEFICYVRPIYVSLEVHIEAHFISCFVALLLIRILELKTKQAALSGTLDQTLKFAVSEIIESIRNYTCSSIGESLYNFHYAILF